ncbi:AMP-binding protein [Trujillonella endophytica]|uniref:Acyl-CoA synthetase (AMP-forming)/AMP-acid ligase II n=1 Tax=Trujillonella endophytica TaxID=673521 RepID=A0A1H8QQU1_9ACTN|nr:AMP-binding protein [Trujillella endophytica]SEO56388.1 Acyl-CoA synthetase (AMP-forming)/AMP-acid ligase II [Trujillella endophytica]
MKVVDKARNSLPFLRANATIIERPDRLVRATVAALPYGNGLLAGVAASVARYPHAPAVVAAGEQVTYRELWRGSTALASELAKRELTSESRIGVLCRNSPWFVHALLGGALLGADIVLLNTSFGPAQLQDTIDAEGIDLVLHDDEFAQALGGTPAISVSRIRKIATQGSGRATLPRPQRHSRLVVLTSGTTGRPKGASRPSDGAAADGVGALLGSIPLRARDTIVVPAPFFHAWGLASLLIGLGLSETIVTAPHFDPAGVLGLVDTHRADALILVPTMLQRICSLPPRELARFRTWSLRVIAASGSAIPGPLVTEVLDRFGPILYNVYGSTEVAAATIAGPRDLRAAPTTAGRRATGVRVAVLDPAGSPAGAGETGRVFVGNAARFDGYTGGGGKESVDGLLSTGDLGHFDGRGLLFVDGREDDMIVSGGENVYPTEVEHLLNDHPDIEEAVVIGVEDPTFGRALKAVVVAKDGRSLDPEDLKAYVAERLARYKVPRQFAFLDELPRTATGKVLRRQLA